MNKGMNEKWIIKNDPFQIVALAFDNLFPNTKYEAWFDPDIKDDEGNEKYGLTQFCDGEAPLILIWTKANFEVAIESFGHELAHVAVGIEHEHDDAWEKAFDDIFVEYKRIGKEMFVKEEQGK